MKMGSSAMTAYTQRSDEAAALRALDFTLKVPALLYYEFMTSRIQAIISMLSVTPTWHEPGADDGP
jgi:hypothetical protein